MTEVTLASLAMDFDVRSADPATKKTNDLRAASRALEEQTRATSEAVRDHAVSQGLSGTAAGRAVQSLNSLVGVYGQARDALGRFAREDGSYRLSQDATTKMILQNAKATEALVKQQDAAARTVQRLTSAYDPLAGEILKVNNQLQQNQRLFDQGRISAEQYATTAGGLTQKLGNLHAAQATGVRSSAALQQATLNLGRQFTDIGVSLAGGQSFGLVMIQQLPQIADGLAVAKQQGIGFKDALGSLAGGARVLFSPGGLIALGALAVGGLALAFAKGQEEAAHFQNALTITGNNAGLTADKYQEMARRISSANNTSFADTKALISQAAASGKLSGDTLALAVENAQAFARYTGESASKYLAEYEKMKEGVAKFGAEHALVYHDLTLQQLKQIAALENAGKSREAELLLMKDIHKEIKERGEPAYGYLEKATLAVTNMAKDMWDAILGVGREKTIGQKLAEAQSQLKGLTAPGSRTQDALKKDASGAYLYGEREAQGAQSAVNAAKLRVSLLTMLSGGQASAAAKSAKAGQSESDQIAKWLKDLNKAGTTPRDMTDERGAQLAKDIAAARTAELQAQLALTKDVEQRAAYEREIAKAESAAKQAEISGKIAAIADDKGLSATKKKELRAGYAALAASEKRVADLKAQAADQQLAAQLLQAELASRQATNAYLDQMDKYTSEAATTQEERNAIELAGLKRRQNEEAYALATSDALKVATGEISAMAAAEAEIRQRNLAFAETESALRKQALDAIERDLDIRSSGYKNDIDILQSEEALARSAGARREIEQKILTARYQMQKAALEAALLTTQDVDKQREIKDALYALGLVYANQLTAGQQLDAAYGDITSALSGAAQAVKAHDWLSATDHLFDAFQTLQKALQGSALNVKIGAVGSLASAAGSIIGGTGGSLLGGLGSGAAAGAQIGSIVPGIGTAIGAGIGAIVGGLGSLFGSSSAKKQQRAQEEAQRAAAEAQRQQQIADTTYGLNLSILQAQGKAEEALAMSRQHELDALAKLDPSLVGLQKQLYAAQDAADAAAKAADLAKQQRALEIQLMQAQGDAAGALAATRADELAAMDASLRGVQQQIYAAQDAAKAQEEALAKASAIADKRASIQDEIDKLTLSSSEQLAKTRAKERAEAVALDPALGALIDKLFGLQDATNAAAQAAAVQEAAAKAAEEAATKAAAAQQALVDQQNALADAGKSAADAFRSLSKDLTDFADSITGGALANRSGAYGSSRAAFLASSGAETIASGKAFLDASAANSGSTAAYQFDAAVVRAKALAEAGKAQRDAKNAEFGAMLIAAVLGGQTDAFSRVAGIPGFASGGSMVLGGSSGIDTNLLSLNGQPLANVSAGEVMTITPARGGASNDNGTAGLLSELRALRQIAASQAADIQSLRSSNAKMERILTSVTEDGRAMLTEAAS